MLDVEDGHFGEFPAGFEHVLVEGVLPILHGDEVDLVGVISAEAVVVHGDEAVVGVELAGALDSFGDVFLGGAGAVEGFFGDVPDDVGEGLVAFDDVVVVEVVGLRFHLGPGDELVPDVDHEVGDELAVVHFRDDFVEVLEEGEVEGGVVGIGVGAEEGEDVFAASVFVFRMLGEAFVLGPVDIV